MAGREFGTQVPDSCERVRTCAGLAIEKSHRKWFFSHASERGTPMRTMQDWLDSYSGDHRNPVNQVFHWFCVPPIVWSAIALLWAIPVPVSQLRPGSWAVLVMVLQALAQHNLPVIGDFLARIVAIVQSRLE